MAFNQQKQVPIFRLLLLTCRHFVPLKKHWTGPIFDENPWQNLIWLLVLRSRVCLHLGPQLPGLRLFVYMLPSADFRWVFNVKSHFSVCKTQIVVRKIYILILFKQKMINYNNWRFETQQMCSFLAIFDTHNALLMATKMEAESETKKNIVCCDLN